MNLIQSINQFLWSFPLLFLLFGIHIYFTIHLHGVQRHVFRGIRLSVSPERSSSSGSASQSAFSALMTTLAATIGTGNIIGMSTAVSLGGPGAVFWCWMTGVLGMSTSYAECYAAHRFRTGNSSGETVGGAMYIFRNVLHKPIMSILYAAAIVIASLFIGCATQSNSIALTGESAFHIKPVLSGLVCALLVSAVLLGGCRTIGRVCSVLVPFMGIFYILCCVILLYLTRDSIQPALNLIVSSAFSRESLCGGILGGGITSTLRYGIARGLFTNEAGMGTAGITAGSTDTDSSASQGLISMTGVFWDTVVMCGITGLLIVAAFLNKPAGILSCSSGELTLHAFSMLPWGGQLLGISLILFALSTIIGWFYLGERSFTFLTQSKTAVTIYKCIYLTAVFGGAILSLDALWELTDFVNLFLLLPNIYLLFRLRHDIMPPGKSH